VAVIGTRAPSLKKNRVSDRKHKAHNATMATPTITTGSLASDQAHFSAAYRPSGPGMYYVLSSPSTMCMSGRFR